MHVCSTVIMRRNILVAVLTLTRASQLLGELTTPSMMRSHTDKENANIANKSLEFVKTIKEDLRRNNDDYAAADLFERQNRLLSRPHHGPPKYSTRVLPRRDPATRETVWREPQINNPIPTNAPLRHPPLRHPPLRNPPSGHPSMDHQFLGHQSLGHQPLGPPQLGHRPSGHPPLDNSPLGSPPQHNPASGTPSLRNPPVRNPPVRNPPVRNPPVRNPPVRNPPVRSPPKRNPPIRAPLSHPVDTRRTLNVSENQTTIATAVTASVVTTSGKDTNATLFRSNTDHPNSIKKVRMEKLKALINLSKSRLREMARTAGGPPAAAPSLDELGDRPRFKRRRTTEPEPTRSSELEQNDPLLRQQREGPMPLSPSPDQIDMAPARGAHIHIFRIKGRLCQRNVLNPEGPKYDSSGSSIMPAHKPELAYGRQFPQTKEPAVLLPRCCNCCKKSVLGCQ